MCLICNFELSKLGKGQCFFLYFNVVNGFFFKDLFKAFSLCLENIFFIRKVTYSVFNSRNAKYTKPKNKKNNFRHIKKF